MVPQGLGDTVFAAAVELVHGYNIVKPGYCFHKLGFIAPITMEMLFFSMIVGIYPLKKLWQYHVNFMLPWCSTTWDLTPLITGC